jgi:hypothetical protein
MSGTDERTRWKLVGIYDGRAMTFVVFLARGRLKAERKACRLLTTNDRGQQLARFVGAGIVKMELRTAEKSDRRGYMISA